MIYGIGIDIAKLDRFTKFSDRSHEQLLDIYSHAELEDLKNYSESSINEFLASRFAAKEAFYKAISNTLISLGFTDVSFSFRFARKHVEVLKGEWDIPYLNVAWDEFEKKIGKKLPKIKAHLSFSHEKDHAVAIVINSLDV